MRSLRNVAELGVGHDRNLRSLKGEARREAAQVLSIAVVGLKQLERRGGREEERERERERERTQNVLL